MGTVTPLHPAPAVTLGGAISAYLSTLDHPQSRATRKAYAPVLAALAGQFGPRSDPAALSRSAVAEWFTARWGDAAPATWNLHLAALRSAIGYWQEAGWAGADPTVLLLRRKAAPGRDRALSRAQVQALLTDKSIPLRERTLWRMLYETAARSAEVLSLDIEDLDLANHSARVTRKGAAQDVIVWQTGTARLLPRLLAGRQTGPVFLTERRARVPLPPCDLDPASGRARLSYRQAAALFTAASGGATLHQLRHSALTHAAEDGTSIPMLLARSGHASVRSLAKYARVSPEALRRHQAATDPARRRGGHHG